MKTSINICLLFFFIFFPCGKKSDPVSTSEEQITIPLIDYSSSIDDSYCKMWSDSSWEIFYRFIFIDATEYATILYSDSTEYYYSQLGYAGFKLSDGSLIIFDNPMPSLPDTIISNETYTQETTFSYQGYNYTLKYDQRLKDTVSVSVPFVTFNTCLWFNAKSTLSVGNQSQTHSIEYWLAKGSSEIKQTLATGETIVMVRGRVNNIGWGMPLTKESLAKTNGGLFKLVRRAIKPLVQNICLK